MSEKATARIPVKPSTLERLKDHMKKDDTYDDFLNRLLDEREKGIYIRFDEIPELEKVKQHLRTQDNKKAVMFLMHLAVETLNAEGLGVVLGGIIARAVEKVLKEGRS